MRGENHNLGAREVAGLHKKSKGEVGVRTEDEKKKRYIDSLSWSKKLDSRAFLGSWDKVLFCPSSPTLVWRSAARGNSHTINTAGRLFNGRKVA